jgi:hypothetical protein
MKIKFLLIAFLAFLPRLSFSQTGQATKCYLNGKQINMDYVFLYPKNIEDIKVKSEAPGGEIYISTKDKKWKYKSLERFLKSYPDYDQIYNKSFTPIFIINDKVINDPDSVQIDSSYFGDLNIKSLSDVKGVSEGCKNLLVVNIELTKGKNIYLRGDNTLYLDKIKH